MYNTLAKKVFAVGVAASTVLMALAPVVKAAPHLIGTAVKSSDGTVWYITTENNQTVRRPFTSGGAFLSYGFLSFSQVVDANGDDLAMPAGSFIPPQDGSIFCASETKGTDVQGECSLITGGMKAAFTSANVFTGLGFSFSRAQYGDSSFLTKTSNINNTTDAHRPGVLVNNGGTVQLVGANGLLGIPDLGTFNSWGYSFSNVVPANNADKAMTQTGVMASRQPGQLSPSALTNLPPVQTGPLTVALGADSPASQTLVTGQQNAVLATFNFMGSGVVGGVNLQRIGVSADTTLANVYLYDGTMRLTDAATVSSNGVINFSSQSGLFTVSGSKTISVVSDIATGTSGQTVGVKINTYTPLGGSAATASVQGNLHTIASATLADVTYGTVTPSGGSQDPAKDVVVFQSTLTVTTRDVMLQRAAIRQIGSVNSTDLVNFRLLIDGTQVAQTQNMDSNSYVTFNLPTAKTLMTGSRVMKVLADVVGGASRNFQFSLRSKTDVLMTDSSYNVGIGSTSTFPVGASSSTSINSGSVTVQKTTDSPSENVTASASDVPLARFTFTAYGEAMKIETLNVKATTSDNSVGSLRNGRIMVNGTQVGSNTTLSATATTSFTTNFTVYPGSPVTVEIRADIFDNDGTNNLGSNDTVTLSFFGSSSNAARQISLGYTGVPSATTNGNTVSVGSGALSLAKASNYVNQTVVAPQSSGYKIGVWNVSNTNVEDVNIDTFNLGFDTSGSFTEADITDAYIKVYNGAALVMTSPIKSTVSSTSTLYSVNLSLPKNTTYSLELWGNIGSSISTDTLNGVLTVSGTSALGGTAVTSSAIDGQVLTGGTGSFTATSDATRPDSAILDDSGTRSVAAFKLDAVSDSYTLTDVTVSFLSSVTTVANVMLKDGSTVLATKPATASTTFNGLNLAVPANSNKVLTVELQLSSVGTGAGTSGEQVTALLHSATGRNSQGTSAALSGTFAVAGQSMYVYKAIPTVTPVALPTGLLSTGTITLAKFTVSSGGTGTVGLQYVTLTVTKSNTTATITSATLWDADTNTQITTTTSTITTLGAGSSSGTIALSPATEQQVSGAKTYEVRATYSAATLSSGDSINSYIAQEATAYAAPVAYLSVLTARGDDAAFVWSDVSASSHSTTTTDWNNSFLVKNLPTTSQSLVK